MSWGCKCQGCDKARKDERERIIKLLEDNARLQEAHPVVWQNAIALIKGEQK